MFNWSEVVHIYKNHDYIAQALLKAGADPERPNNHGWTPLMKACENGHELCAWALLDIMHLPEDNCFISSFGTVALSGVTMLGKVYYELTLTLICGGPQIGWATSGFAPGNGNGVGDDALSWGADGLRGHLWHNGTAGLAHSVGGWRHHWLRSGPWERPNLVRAQQCVDSGV